MTSAKGNRKGTLADLLHHQGFGSRRECIRLIRDGRVETGRAEGGAPAWRPADDPGAILEPQGLHFRVAGLALPYRERLDLVFHKPADAECSRAPAHHRSVYSYLPEPFLRRDIQAVGRLDADTTGLLLFTDDGGLNHFLTSPKRHVPKTYRVETRHPITEAQAQALRAGVALRDEEGLTRPAGLELQGEKACLMTIEEGKYHQVKRMFAAAGNRVEAIHRIAVGALRLEPGLEPGQWRFLESHELTALGYAAR